METPGQAELPFDSEIVTVALSDEQAQQLLPLVQRQVVDRRGLLFMSVAPYWSVQDGQTNFRLQAKWIDRKAASRILKIIRETDAKNNGPTGSGC